MLTPEKSARIAAWASTHELTPGNVAAFLRDEEFTGGFDQITLDDIAAYAGVTVAYAQAWIDGDNAYLIWLKDAVYRAGGRDRHYVPPMGEFGPEQETGVYGLYGRLIPNPAADPAIELGKYNTANQSIDLAWAQLFLDLNDYYTNGEFSPGAPTATIQTLHDAQAQWEHDAAPGMFTKVAQAAMIAAIVYVAWTTLPEMIGTTEVTAGGAMDMGVGGSGILPSYPSVGAMATATVESVPSIAPTLMTDAEIAAITTPEMITSASFEIAGAGTTATAATIAKTGYTAAQILGTAKSVIGAAGTIATITKMVSGATKINPATGAAYGLPPGYQPIVTPGQGAGGLPLNYSGIISQLAIPAAALLGIFLLKG